MLSPDIIARFRNHRLSPFAHLISLNLPRPIKRPYHLRPLFLSPIILFFTRLFGTFAGPNPATMSAAKNRAQQLINDNAVVVFSKSYCPYCDSSKKLLDGLSAKYTTLEL